MLYKNSLDARYAAKVLGMLHHLLLFKTLFTQFVSFFSCVSEENIYFVQKWFLELNLIHMCN